MKSSIRRMRRAALIPWRLWVSRRLPRLRRRISDNRFASVTFCVGDSHVSLFTGRDIVQPIWPLPGFEISPQFRCFNIGPALAYNLGQRANTTLSRERLHAAISFVPQESQILLSFGEIDCRAHLLKQRGSLDANILECVERYFRVVTKFARNGFRLIIYNVPPSSLKSNFDHNFPVVGNCRERNEVTINFNERLQEACNSLKIPFVATTRSFLTPTGLTDESWFMDPVHLSQRAFNITVNAICQLPTECCR
jgi:hypothetical protein